MSNYSERLYNLIEEIKADKSFPNPWRNYVGSDGVRLQALIERGEKTVTRAVPDEVKASMAADLQKQVTGFDPTGPHWNAETGCTCPPGTVSRDCKVHRGLVD